MALSKPKLLSNGVTAEYYRIDKVTVHKPSHMVEATLGLYLDQATALAGGTPLVPLMKNYTFTLTVPEINTNIIATLYSKILTKAASTVSMDFQGNVLSPAAAFDSDLDGATSV